MRFLRKVREFFLGEKKVYPEETPNLDMYDFFTKKKIDKLNMKVMDMIPDPGFPGAILNYSSTYEGPKVKRFVIPVNGLSREKAEAQIRELMRDYHDDVQWGGEWGDGGLDSFKAAKPAKPINRVYSDLDPYGEENWDDVDSDDDDTKIPFQKDYWFPTKGQRNLMEQAKMIYSKNNAAIYKKFVIPLNVGPKPLWEPVLE